MAENTIDNLSIQVTASADNAARGFDRLASSAGRVKGAASGAAGGMEEMADGAKDAEKATRDVETQTGRARKKFVALAMLRRTLATTRRRARLDLLRSGNL